MSGGKPGVKWGFAAGATLSALGLGLGAGRIVRTLQPQISPEQLASAMWGARAAQALLLADGLMLMGLAYAISQGAYGGAAKTFTPLWAPAARRGEPSEWLNRRYPTLLARLLLAAAAVRLIALNSDLWMDEVFTLVRTVRPPWGSLLAVYVDDNQHTLYSLLAKGSVAMLGESPASLRAPAVLFGVAGLWATARLADLTFGKREALLAAALLAFSYHHVWFSQNARAYTLLLFAATLSTEALLRGLNTGRRRYWALYALTGAAGAWAHLSMALFAAAQAVVVAGLLLRSGRALADWRRPAAAFALAAWLTLHCYALVIPQVYTFFSQPGAGSAPASLWTRPAWMVREILAQAGLSGGLGWAAAAAAAPFAVLGVYWLGRRDWIFLALATAPALLAGAAMVALGRSLWPRSFFHLIGLVVIAAAAAAIAAGDRVAGWLPGPPKLLRLAPALILCLVCGASLPFVYLHPKQDYTAARDFVRNNLGPADSVAALHMAGRVYSLYYAPEWSETNTIEELGAIKSKQGRTWVIYTLPSYLESRRPELAALLQREYEPVRTFPGTLSDGDLFVLRSKRPQ